MTSKNPVPGYQKGDKVLILSAGCVVRSIAGGPRKGDILTIEDFHVPNYGHHYHYIKFADGSVIGFEKGQEAQYIKLHEKKQNKMISEFLDSNIILNSKEEFDTVISVFKSFGYLTAKVQRYAWEQKEYSPGQTEYHIFGPGSLSYIKQGEMLISNGFLTGCKSSTFTDLAELLPAQKLEPTVRISRDLVTQAYEEACPDTKRLIENAIKGQFALSKDFKIKVEDLKKGYATACKPWKDRLEASFPDILDQSGMSKIKELVNSMGLIDYDFKPEVESYRSNSFVVYIPLPD